MAMGHALFGVLLGAFISCILLHKQTEAAAAKSKLKIAIEKVETVANEDYLTITVTINNDTGIYVADVYANLKVELKNNLFVKSNVQTMVRKGQYQTLIKNDFADMCAFLKNPSKEPFMKMMFENIQKYGNLMQKCPVEKGEYFVKAFRLDPSVLPSFTPLGKYMVDVETSLKENGKYISLYKMKWYASVTKL